MNVIILFIDILLLHVIDVDIVILSFLF